LIHIDFTAQKFMALRFENAVSGFSLGSTPDYLPARQFIPGMIVTARHHISRKHGAYARVFFSSILGFSCFAAASCGLGFFPDAWC
jgi:hypothetical protein